MSICSFLRGSGTHDITRVEVNGKLVGNPIFSDIRDIMSATDYITTIGNDGDKIILRGYKCDGEVKLVNSLSLN